MTWSVPDLTKEDLETLISQHLNKVVKLDSYKVHPLTRPGDNYSSTMLAVDAVLQKHPDKPQTISLVAKLMPPTKFLCEVINIDITFRKEVNAYILVLPEFYNLQKEKRMPENEILDVFPRVYGARINRKENMNDKADSSAILLLEDLKKSGYTVGDRRNGLSLKHMQLGITKLAQFHAISVALKIKKPQVFKETILKACENFQVASEVDETGLPKWINLTLGYVKEIPDCEPYLQRIEKALVQSVQKVLPPTEPFSTFIHNDLWVNNMLFQYKREGDYIPCGIKFVDFQLTQFASPAKDLIFFIHSSAQRDVIDSHYNDLVQLYHYKFISFLKKLDCNCEEFSLEKLLEEIDKFGSGEFAHLLMMFKFICADETLLPEMSNDNIEELLEINTGGDIYVKKVVHLVKDFSQKGWL